MDGVLSQEEINALLANADNLDAASDQEEDLTDEEAEQAMKEKLVKDNSKQHSFKNELNSFQKA